DFAGHDGMPVILGTSQTQVVTGQDGLASIVPTVGSLGPCDAFITVTAGNAAAQFELENVDPLAAQPPPKKNGRTAPSRSVVRFDAAAVSAQPLGTASILFAVPQEMPSPDQPAAACSDSSQEAPCEAASDTAISGTAEIAQPGIAAPTPEALPQEQSGPQSALPDVKPAAQPVEPPSITAPASRPDTQNTATSVPATQSAAALLDDRRSCRFAEKE